MSDTIRSESISIAPRELRPLIDRLSDPIEEASIGVSALLSKIIRQSIRTGIQKLDEGLEETVREKVDLDLTQRGPELTEAAQIAAREEVTDQMDRLRKQAKRTGMRFKAAFEGLTLANKEIQDQLAALRAETDGQVERVRSEATALQDDLRQQLTRSKDEFAKQLHATRSDLVEQLQREKRELAQCLAQATERVGQLRQLLDEHAETIAGLAEQNNAFAQRCAALEERVFKPGIFSRITGMFRGKPKPEIEGK